MRQLHSTFREFNHCHSGDSGQFCSKATAASAGNADVWLPLQTDEAGTASPAARTARIADVVRAQATTDAEMQHADLIAQAEYENEVAFEKYGAEGSMGLYRQNGEWTPERQALHRKIIEGVLAQGVPTATPAAVFLSGMPAAGKTTASKGLTMTGKVLINSDEIKGMLPEYTGKNAAFLNAESSFLADTIFTAAVAQRKSLVYDGTMKTLGETGAPDIARVTTLKRAGYRVEARFSDVDVQTSVQRAMNRFSKDGRYVPVGFIRSMSDAKWGTKPRATFESLRSSFDAYVLVDNKGKQPVVVSSFGKLTEAARVLDGWRVVGIWGGL